MMKIIGRIALILAAVALVSGLVYLAASSAGSGLNSLPDGGGGDQIRQGMGERPGKGLGRQQQSLAEGRGLHEGQVGSGWSGLLVQLGKVALITVAVLALQWLVRSIRRRRKAGGGTAAG